MVMRETPMIMNMAYSNSTTPLGSLGAPFGASAQQFMPQQLGQNPFTSGGGLGVGTQPDAYYEAVRSALDAQASAASVNQFPPPPPQPQEKIMATNTRVVRVLIADPCTSVPLKKRILYRSDEIPTESTDQELFFDIDLKAVLEKHNAERVTFRNLAIRDRSEMLEPARIRDLSMTVTLIAAF